MPVTITAPLANLTLSLSAQNVEDLARAIDLTIRRAQGAILGVQVAAETMGDLWDAIEDIGCRMDDPDRIAAVRVDEAACRTVLDVAARPVDLRRLR